MRVSAGPNLVNRMRRIITFVLALVALPAVAQLPVADLRASHIVLTEVPTLRSLDLPPLTPDYVQIVRVRIENRGPVDVPDASGRLLTGGFLRPDLVDLTVDAACGVNIIGGATYTGVWPIGQLRVGEFRECDFTLRATGAGPAPPPSGGSSVAIFGFVPASQQTRPPPPLTRFGETERFFTIAPTVAVLADYAVRIEPSTVRVDPGTFHDVSVFITNRGPQAVNPAQTIRFFGWFDRYNGFGPPPYPPDPFVISPFVLPGCRFQNNLPPTSPPRDIELVAIVDQTIAPGETRECRIRVVARPEAIGERSLRFTQRIFFGGVVDPNLSDNIATLRMIFSDPPTVPVPTASKTMLVVMGMLLALVGVASFARPYSRNRVRW